ncbi:hypothetical protein [Vulcanisaeta sp. JCM 16161]|uniref:phosphoribosyltransferase n=1 Tax=Vulcanisaeta sp. JCM 16161 TaxID=1295372 RepID=UPI000B03FCB1|nr:phosphoribosyltransferase family protein [Vulcanisaeta sp. JCM 16161]
MEFLILNWQELVNLTLDLSLMIKESGYRPDSIIAILRGGYIVGKLVSDFLGVDDLVVLGLVSYGTRVGQGEEPVITYPIIRDLRGRSVLVVDDVADTGKTLLPPKIYLSSTAPGRLGWRRSMLSLVKG